MVGLMAGMILIVAICSIWFVPVLRVHLILQKHGADLTPSVWRRRSSFHYLTMPSSIPPTQVGTILAAVPIAHVVVEAKDSMPIETIEILSRESELSTVNIRFRARGSALSAEVIEALASNASRLRELTLLRAQISKTHLQALAQSSSVTRVNLLQCELDASACTTLGLLSGLRCLNLAGSRFADPGKAIERLGNSPAGQIDLSNTNISSALIWMLVNAQPKTTLIISQDMLPTEELMRAEQMGLKFSDR